MTRMHLILLFAPALLSAQDSTQAGYSSAVSLNVGMVGVGGRPIAHLTTIGVAWTELRSNSIGVDAALGTAPYGLAYGVIPGAGRLGFVVPIEVAPSIYVTPMAGGSAAFVIPGGAAIIGGYGGVSLLSWFGSDVGTRATLTVHRFAGADTNVFLGEIGLAWRLK